MHNSVKVEFPESRPTTLGDLVKGQILKFHAESDVYIVTSNDILGTCVQVVNLNRGSAYSLDRNKPCTPIPPYATITIRTYL